MHGIIFTSLYKYVRENHGFEVLEKIKKDANISTPFYDATKSHPDAEIQALIASACKILGADRDALLEGFGAYLTPGLIKTYSSYMNPDWDCMDLLEHIESSMHRAVRKSMHESAPPALKVHRLNKDQILIEYTSERKMIALGIGIIKAIGTNYKETLTFKRTPTENGVNLTVTRQK